MNLLEKMNKLVGRKCWHGSPGMATEERITAIDVNIVKENIRVEFESGFFTSLPAETMEILLDQWEDGYTNGVVYNPWKCSITRRSGMLEQLML